MINKINRSRGGFTLVEIMIVVAIIILLAAIAVPSFLRARKRSQAGSIKEELRLIDGAVDQYAIEYNKSAGNTITWGQVQLYLKKGTRLYNSGGKDLLGGTYTMPSVDALPQVPAATNTALSDVADAEFWSPYPIGS